MLRRLLAFSLFLASSAAVAFGLLLLAVCAAPLLAGPEAGTIEGRVIDDLTGTPLPYANVVVLRTPFGASVGKDGSFVVRFVPAGTYEVRASFVDYQAVTLSDVDVTGDTTRLDFRLPPGPWCVRWGPCGPTPEYRRDLEARDLPDEPATRIRIALGLRPPVEVHSWVWRQNGESIAATLQDSCGTTMHISWDGAVPEVPMHELNSAGSTSAQPHSLYFGASWKEAKSLGIGSSPIAIGSPVETALLDVLRAWTDKQVPVVQQDSLLKFLSAPSGSHVTNDKPDDGLSPSIHLVLDVVKVIRVLEFQRDGFLGTSGGR